MALKRGALVAAANWPVVLIQAAADALFKVLIAFPLIGGVILASLVVGADVNERATDWRALAADVVSTLLDHGAVAVAFLLALGVVVAGGSMFVFLVKGGTMGVLVRGDRDAGPLEEEPIQGHTLARASSFSIELFVASAGTLFRRYARLGFMLLTVYLLSGAAFVASLLWWGPAGERWGYTSIVTLAFVVWVTVVNLLYLLVQIVVAAEDCGVSAAVRRVMLFLRQERRIVGSVFVMVLAMVLLATAASVVAFTALGLILVIPFMWLAAIPLQLIAFLLRALVFQYIDLASIAAYLKLYREHSRGFAAESTAAPVAAWTPPADVPHA